MTGYRDETETLREELRRTSAELARVNAELMKSEPREIDAVQWRDEYGGVATWVYVAVGLLVSTTVGTCAASHDVYGEGHPRASAFFAAISLLSAIATVVIFYRAAPRTKVKR